MVQIYNRTYDKSISVVSSEDVGLSFSRPQTIPDDIPQISVPDEGETRRYTKRKSDKSSVKKTKQAKEEDDSSDTSVEALIHCAVNPDTYLHALHGNSDAYSLTRALEKVQPRLLLVNKFSVLIFLRP